MVLRQFGHKTIYDQYPALVIPEYQVLGIAVTARLAITVAILFL